MSKRISKEEVVSEYFSHEPDHKVEVMFNIVKGIMRHRMGSSPAPSNGSGTRTKAAVKGTATKPKAAGGQASNAVQANTPSPVKDSDQLPM